MKQIRNSKFQIRNGAMALFVIALAFSLCGPPLAALAQAPGKVWRIGALIPQHSSTMEEVLEGLRALNYVQGRDFNLEHRRYMRGDQLPALAAELVQRNPDVLVGGTGRASLALKAATKTIPIVIASSGDAVAQGLVASLARPGGNVTGSTSISPVLVSKRLELLREAAPRATQIVTMGCSPEGSPMSKREWSEVQSAAQSMSLNLIPIFIRQPEELSGGFERAMREKIDSVLVLDCGNLPPPVRVTELVNASRVPALYPYPWYVQAGGLMSYGPNSAEMHRRAAIFVDKILRGAKPGDIPVEQPARYEFVVNLKTAKTLGLTIPSSLLMRADQVIE